MQNITLQPAKRKKSESKELSADSEITEESVDLSMRLLNEGNDDLEDSPSIEFSNNFNVDKPVANTVNTGNRNELFGDKAYTELIYRFLHREAPKRVLPPQELENLLQPTPKALPPVTIPLVSQVYRISQHTSHSKSAFGPANRRNHRRRQRLQQINRWLLRPPPAQILPQVPHNTANVAQRARNPAKDMCVICKKTPEIPVIANCSGCLFCRACLVDLLKGQSRRCPKCNKLINRFKLVRPRTG